MSLSYEQRTTRTPLTWSLHISTSPHLHLRSLHLTSFNQQIGLALPTNIIIFSSGFVALLLQAHLSVAFVYLKSYIGRVFIVSCKNEPTSIPQLRTDTFHVPSYI